MLAYITITSLIVLFFHACTTPGMIFHAVEKAMENFPSWIQKPFYSCPVCMSMWWGQVVVVAGKIWLDWQVNNYIQLLFICMAAGGINMVIVLLKPEKAKTCDCDAVIDRKKRLGLL